MIRFINLLFSWKVSIVVWCDILERFVSGVINGMVKVVCLELDIIKMLIMF